MAGILFWTPERIDAVRRLMAEGLSHRQVATTLKHRWRHQVTPTAVRHQCQAHGIVSGCVGGSPHHREKKAAELS